MNQIAGDARYTAEVRSEAVLGLFTRHIFSTQGLVCIDRVVTNNRWIEQSTVTPLDASERSKYTKRTQGDAFIIIPFGVQTNVQDHSQIVLVLETEPKRRITSAELTQAFQEQTVDQRFRVLAVILSYTNGCQISVSTSQRQNAKPKIVI
jgi:hypothetical protein